MKRRPRHMWTQQEVQYLRDHYAHTLTVDIAAALGLEPKRVLAKANSLHLYKSIELIRVTARARTGDHHASVAYRWPKGNQPWNTGRTGLTGVQPGCRAHHFRPGNKPHTWVPVGSIRIKDGVPEVKYSDNPGPPHLRWRFLGRHLWEQAHGPVPKGHLVVFKPGRATTDAQCVTLDDVELITRREIMARNTCHRLPKPLKQVIHLRGVLTRAINRRAKAARQTEEANT